jgi:hypothetical protein
MSKKSKNYCIVKFQNYVDLMIIQLFIFLTEKHFGWTFFTGLNHIHQKNNRSENFSEKVRKFETNEFFRIVGKII